MKKLILPFLIAGAALAAPASASESEDFCNAFTAQFDIDPGPCPCVGEVAEANPDVKEAVLALTDPSETDSWDPALQEKLSICFPQNQ